MPMPERLGANHQVDAYQMNEVFEKARSSGDNAGLHRFFDANLGRQARLLGDAKMFLIKNTNQLGFYGYIKELPFSRVEIISTFPEGVAVQTYANQPECPVLEWDSLDQIPPGHSDEVLIEEQLKA
jgi:hypothetical protein